MNDAEGIAEVMKKYDYSLYADGCTWRTSKCNHMFEGSLELHLGRPGAERFNW